MIPTHGFTPVGLLNVMAWESVGLTIPIDPARGSNATINKTKSLDWVWLTVIDPYMLPSSDYFNLDDCHRVTRITKQ